MLLKIGLLIIIIILFFIPAIELYTIAENARNTVSLFQISIGNFHPFGSQYHLIAALILPIIMIMLLFIKKKPSKLMPFLSTAGLLYGSIATLFIGHSLAFREYILNRTSQTAIWFLIGAWLVLTLNLLAEQKQKTENIDPPYSRTQKMVISAIMLALGVITAVAMRPFNIPIGGANILNVSFAGFFHNVTAIFFGPFFGGAARGLADIIAFMISPRPPFLIAITLTAVLRGALIGYMWQKIRNVNPLKFAIFYSVSFSILMIIGTVNIIMWHFQPYSNFTLATLPPTANATAALSYGFLIAGVLGIALQIAIYAYSKISKNSTFYIRFLKLFITIVFPGLLANALNTYILFVSVISPATVGLGIMYFFVPRFFEELITSTISVYVMVLVMALYERTIRRKVVQK
ncbi:MAG: ECF transporter S component [Defluviitaleaceae bacterium]|nr:ECF transporter S component [Defluviitaleaceae bacterium]